MRLLRLLVVLLLVILAACETVAPIQDSVPTSIPISRVLATVYISPTPNVAAIESTQQAFTATPLPPTPTLEASGTPYVGVFIGEVQRDAGFAPITEPLFAENVSDAEPTANAGRCAIPINGTYIPAWSNNGVVNRRMGCPIQEAFGFFGDVQVFENGVMYHNPDVNAVWAISTQFDRGTFWYLENPPTIPEGLDRSPLPQPPLRLPDGIFDRMWVAVDEVPGRLGFAQTEPQEAPLGAQRFENGTFLYDESVGQVYALITDGTAYGPFLAPTLPTPTPIDNTPIPTITPLAEETEAGT